MADPIRAALERLLSDIQDLSDSSQGIVGLHRNGDPAPWNELPEGGRYSSWLGDAIEAARDAARADRAAYAVAYVAARATEAAARDAAWAAEIHRQRHSLLRLIREAPTTTPAGQEAPNHMAKPQPLSPAAQAVMDAFNREARPEPHHQQEAIAAALRAATDQVVPELQEPDWGACVNTHCDIELYTDHQRKRTQLLAIAAELEAQQ